MGFSNHLVVFFFSLLCSTSLAGQELEKLNNLINSNDYDEISPVLSHDGHTLFFTRVADPNFNKHFIMNGLDVYEAYPEQYNQILREVYQQITGRFVRDPARSDFNQDIWIAESHEAFFDTIKHPGFPMNNALPNSVCAATFVPNQYIVINQFPRDGGMRQGFSLIRRRIDDSWAPPQAMHVKGYISTGKGVNLSMSDDGEMLFLAMDESSGFGKHDLYVSHRESDGFWSPPINLGPYINSEHQELSPCLSDDGRTLFFASDRPGADGLDIYVSQRDGEAWDSWSVPQRLGAPINSPFDDSQPHFNAATGYLYFTSKRDGSSDIFRMLIREPKDQDEVTVTGQVLDSSSGKLKGAKIYMSILGQEEERTFYLSADGNFRIQIPKGKTVRLRAEKDGYVGQIQTFKFDEQSYVFRGPQTSLNIDPLKVDAQISLHPIFFEQSKPTILNQSFGELEYLVEVLQEHPQISIQVEGHTDNVGDIKALVKLSEERAEAVRNFLVDKGISPERVSVKGFGPARPVNDNMNDEQRKANRRVEVRITKVDG
jgi:outer membrane protein OmpA-like peptidoglycan-associated protein